MDTGGNSHSTQSSENLPEIWLKQETGIQEGWKGLGICISKFSGHADNTSWGPPLRSTLKCEEPE